jgi:hypothetical protein
MDTITEAKVWSLNFNILKSELDLIKCRRVLGRIQHQGIIIIKILTLIRQLVESEEQIFPLPQVAL